MGGGLWLSSCRQHRGKVSEKRDLFVNLVALLIVRAYAIEIAGLSGSGNEFGCFCAVWPIAVAALHTAVVSAQERVSEGALDQLLIKTRRANASAPSPVPCSGTPIQKHKQKATRAHAHAPTGGCSP